MTREEIRYHTDPEPSMTGWWIVSIDEGFRARHYDSVGPYPTAEDAKALAPKALIIQPWPYKVSAKFKED